MIKPKSNLKEYTLIYSGDPALRLPEDPKERDRVLDLAHETSDWQGLIADGQEPTLFIVEPLIGARFDWWLGECRRRQLITLEGNVLALRLVLKAVHNFGAYKVERKRDGEFVMATMDIIDALYAEAGRDVVQELGALVVERAEKPLSPKS